MKKSEIYKKRLFFKILISIFYTILLIIFMNWLFTYTPLKAFAFLDNNSPKDVFYNQFFSFLSYVILFIFVVIQINSLSKMRDIIHFYRIKEKNPNDPRVRDMVEPKGCGIWNPICYSTE